MRQFIAVSPAVSRRLGFPVVKASTPPDATLPHPDALTESERPQPMTIVRSIGTVTLVALMAAHRAAAERENGPLLRQDTLEAIEAYLRATRQLTSTGVAKPTASPPSYS